MSQLCFQTRKEFCWAHMLVTKEEADTPNVTLFIVIFQLVGKVHESLQTNGCMSLSGSGVHAADISDQEDTMKSEVQKYIN